MVSLSTKPWLVRVSGSFGAKAATPYSGSLKQVSFRTYVPGLGVVYVPEHATYAVPFQETPLELLRLVKIRPSSPRMPSEPVPPEIQSLPQPPIRSSSCASP